MSEKGDSMSEHWNRFYTAYPKKEGRGAALKAWEKATKGMTPDELEVFTQKVVTSIHAQKKSRWDASERKYIPMPATWLNQSRWDDEISSAAEAPKQIVNEICQCGNKAFNRVMCSRCYTKMANPLFAEHMRHNLRNMGFTKSKDETWREASMRCLKANGLISLIPKSVL